MPYVLPEYDPDTDPLRGDAEARARDDAYWAPIEKPHREVHHEEAISPEGRD